MGRLNCIWWIVFYSSASATLLGGPAGRRVGSNSSISTSPNEYDSCVIKWTQWTRCFFNEEKKRFFYMKAEFHVVKGRVCVQVCSRRRAAWRSRVQSWAASWTRRKWKVKHHAMSICSASLPATHNKHTTTREICRISYVYTPAPPAPLRLPILPLTSCPLHVSPRFPSHSSHFYATRTGSSHQRFFIGIFSLQGPTIKTPFYGERPAGTIQMVRIGWPLPYLPCNISWAHQRITLHLQNIIKFFCNVFFFLS